MAVLVYAKRVLMDDDARVFYDFGAEMHDNFEGRLGFDVDDPDSWFIEGESAHEEHAAAAAYAVRKKFLATGEWPVGAVYAA